MIAEILCIGTELLMGQVLNTNAQFLSRRLSALGITQQHQTVVGDNEARLTAAYTQALSRADIVITSGGLGPTGDDITKRVLAALLNKPLVENAQALKHVTDYFDRTGRVMTNNNLSQALFTPDSILLKNHNGTAPGAIVPCDAFGQGKIAIHLPGPPYELEPMFDESVFPYLEARSGQRIISRYIRIFGMGESNVDALLKDLMQGVNPSLSPYCSMGEVQLRATALCSDPTKGERMLAPLIDEVKHRLGDAIYAIHDTDRFSLAQAVSDLLKAKQLTLCTCESLTGGLLSSELVALPGASECFKGGLVTYTNAQKMSLAGVNADTLERFGAVSEQCAMEMAFGARERIGADIAVSLTGCAGPDTDERQTPVGQCFIGIATKDGARAVPLNLSGSRQRIRTLCVLHALNHVRLQIIDL